MKRNRGKLWGLLLAAAAAAVLSGCSRSVLNYQVAECIGTLDKYENNEPVETPKMKAERENQESEEALEKERTDTLEQAAALALEYQYDEAIALLSGAEALQEDERASDAIEEYQAQLDGMYEYSGVIGHLCFTNLVVDTQRAFDGDEYAQIYRENMITLAEFEAILDELYKSGYVLIDIHSLAEETQNSSGDVSMTQKLPYLPQGKKPIIISVENLDYSSVSTGDGIATRLALDENGEVGALYTDAEGHDLIGAYDVVPVLEQFIAEHPDFSYQGARGIIGLSGENGIYGYQISSDTAAGQSDNLETVQQITEKLREDGWTFASQGYSYQYMGDMSYETLKGDMESWQTSVGAVVGTCDTILFPYGSQPDYESEKGAYLINQGYHYMVGLWTDGDHLEVNSTYLRQTRRMVTGYVFENYPNNYDTYFLTSAVKDSARS